MIFFVKKPLKKYVKPTVRENGKRTLNDVWSNIKVFNKGQEPLGKKEVPEIINKIYQFEESILFSIIDVQQGEILYEFCHEMQLIVMGDISQHSTFLSQNLFSNGEDKVKNKIKEEDLPGFIRRSKEEKEFGKEFGKVGEVESTGKDAWKKNEGNAQIACMVLIQFTWFLYVYARTNLFFIKNKAIIGKCIASIQIFIFIYLYKFTFIHGGKKQLTFRDKGINVMFYFIFIILYVKHEYFTESVTNGFFENPPRLLSFYDIGSLQEIYFGYSVIPENVFFTFKHLSKRGGTWGPYPSYLRFIGIEHFDINDVRGYYYKPEEIRFVQDGDVFDDLIPYVPSDYGMGSSTLVEQNDELDFVYYEEETDTGLDKYGNDLDEPKGYIKRQYNPIKDFGYFTKMSRAYGRIYEGI